MLVRFSTLQNEEIRKERHSSTEVVSRVPEIMYESFRCLQNPRKFTIFEQLCLKGSATTKDLEALSGSTLGYVNDTLRELDQLKLAKYEGKASPYTIPGRKIIREGDLEETFKCYSATEHGRLIHTLCKAYDSEKPLANLSNALDPKDVVESFAKLEKDDLSLMLNKFRDMYYLGALLISLRYQEEASASSNTLSSCLYGRLYPQEIDQLMKNYSSQSGLVLIEHSELGPVERILHSLGHFFKGRFSTDRWASFSRASYSLTPEGERVAEKLADQFSPEDLGVDREYLQDEFLEVEEGTLTSKIVTRVLIVGGLVGFVAWALIQPATTLSALVGKLAFAFLGIAAMGMTIRGIWNRMILRREQKLQDKREDSRPQT
jgi:hypothetical protein